MRVVFTLLGVGGRHVATLHGVAVDSVARAAQGKQSFKNGDLRPAPVTVAQQKGDSGQRTNPHAEVTLEQAELPGTAPASRASTRDIQVATY